MRDGTFYGWDDPRLATFAALRKRGITAEAIKKMIIDVGPKPADVTLSWENLYSYNRKILDPQCDRYFFVAEPIKLTVKNLPKTFTAKLPLHPEKPEKRLPAVHRDSERRGKRGDVLDCEERCCQHGGWQDGEADGVVQRQNSESAAADSVEAVFQSESYEDVRKTKAQLIQWIPVGEERPCSVVFKSLNS